MSKKIEANKYKEKHNPAYYEWRGYLSISPKAMDFISAAESGNTRGMMSLLEENNDLADRDRGTGLTMLHMAAEFGYAEAADVLLGLEAFREDFCDADGVPSFHYAAKHGDVDTIKPFLSYVERFVLKQNSLTGDTAMHVAANAGHLDVMKLIMSKAPDLIHINNYDEKSVFDVALECLETNIKKQHIARVGGHIDAIKWLHVLETASDKMRGLEVIGWYIEASELLNTPEMLLNLPSQAIRNEISSFFLSNECKSISHKQEFRCELLKQAHIKKASEFMAHTIIKVFNEQSAQPELEVKTKQLSELMQQELTENSNKFKFVFKELRAELMSRIYKLIIQPEHVCTEQNIKNTIYEVIDTVPTSLVAKYNLVGQHNHNAGAPEPSNYTAATTHDSGAALEGDDIHIDIAGLDSLSATD